MKKRVTLEEMKHFYYRFLGEHLGFFISSCFSFFLFSFLLLLISWCFHFFMFLILQMFLLFTTLFCQVLRFCVVTGSATDLRERFLLSGVFYLTLLPDIWHNLLLSRFAWGQDFSLEGCRAFHWGLKHRLNPSIWITKCSATIW